MRNRTSIYGFGDRYSTVELKAYVAEEVGFEPTGLITPGCFQDSYLNPLGHSSMIAGMFNAALRAV